MEAQAWPATEKQDEHEYSPSREADSSEEDGDWGQNGRESQNEYANPKQTPAPQVTIYFWICYHGNDTKKYGVMPGAVSQYAWVFSLTLTSNSNYN